MVASKVKSSNVCNFGSGNYTLVIIRTITGWGGVLVSPTPTN